MASCSFHAVLYQDQRGRPRLRTARISQPALEPGEIVVKVNLEVPDEAWDPMETTLIVNPADVGLCVEQEPVEA